MIDLEIDVKQHWTHEERIKSDRKRDKLLKRNNYKIYRIKWKSINNEKGEKYIKNEIAKFLKFYNGM
jgi:very-short-patch-repair endonuclease